VSGLRDLREEVLDEVGTAALPRAAGKHGGNGRLQTGMGVGDRELDAPQPAGDERAQEAEPGRSVLAREDVHAEDLPVSGLVDAGGHDDRDVHGPTALTALHFEGVEPEVGVGGFQGPLAESLHGLVEFAGDLGDPRLGDPRQPEGLHQALHAAGGDAEDVRLGDNGKKRPFRAAPRLQEPLRKVRALPKSRDSQGHLADTGFQGTYPIAVAGVDALLGTLAVVGPAERIGLVTHQLLEKHPKQLTKQVGAGLLEALAKGDGERDAGLGHGRRPPEVSKSALETLQAAGRGPL